MRILPNTLRLAAAGALALAPLSAAIAQEPADDKEDLRVRIGLGAQVRPDYPGADGMRWSPLVDVAIARGDDQFDFDAPDDSFDIKLYARDGLAFGPVANLAPGRKRSDVGARVDKVSRTIEVGGFVQYSLSDSFRLRTEVRKGIGGHDGVIASVGADKIWRDGDNYVISVGPRVLLADSTYQRAFFGVDQDAAIASGLPRYRPDGGVMALGATSGATVQLNPRWGLFGYGRYERLVGDAARSPIVREFGSRNQFSAGAGVTYSFTIRR